MFKGSIVAIVTPMDATGAIDYECFARLLDWHLTNGTDGVVVLGTTGESATVHMDERKQLIQLATDQIKGRIPVIVGTGTNSTDTTIQLTHQALEWGADAALVVTPYYNKPTQEGLFQHYKAVAEAVPLPQILYNVPSRTACDLLPETIIRLGKISNIVGVKEATGDQQRVKQILAADCYVDVFSGDDATGLEFMLLGAKGVISVTANVVPKLFHDLCLAALSGERDRASCLDQQLRPLYKALFLESNPIPTKWALQELGLIDRGIRLPLTPLTAKFHDAVRQALQQINI
ncbi:MAG: 4-hydroxy-tetrahydrodipicolinate synthase [Coxiella sp. RIFCSPHIGHO2_12_FULL_42_15]|nr:MAG: 4-hydroxy-tetrahydrodipicolinate synthase [Coxiella sp. RIFCSPHIGHO2_12_FULL_42_15]